MGKLLLFGIEAREKLLQGVHKTAQAVGSTLGPKGSNVTIARTYGPPLVMHDGVSVAREVDLTDPFENLGAQLVKEAASKTNDAAGDGTTTATVLADAIATEAHKNIVAGSNPMMIRRGIEIAVKEMDTELNRLAIPITKPEEILQVATISAQNTEIGDIVATSIQKMGKDGVLAVEESGGQETYLEVKEGMEFAKGWLSPYFITNPELSECVLDDPYILVTDLKLSTVNDVIFALKKFDEAETDNRNILIIAEEVVGDALAMLITNKVRGAINVCAVQAPGYGDKRKDLLKDIATVTGATYFSAESGSRMESVNLADFGRAGRVTTTKDSTMIVDGKGNKEVISQRITELKNAFEKAEVDFDRERLQERIAKLTSGIGIIFVGASSESEMREKKERVIDAISATKAAMDEGIVPGGETALLRAALSLNDIDEKGDVAIGISIIKRASEQPFRKLVSNAGYDEGRMLSLVEKALSKKNHGIDVIDGESKDLVKNGVIDPVKVTKSALRNAASVATMILTTDTLIVDEPKNDQSA